VIVKKWQILQQLLQLWYLESIALVLECCIIFHNMVVENKRNNYTINEWVRNQLVDANLNNNDNLAHVSLYGNNNVAQPGPNVLGPGQAGLRGMRVASSIDDPYKHMSLKEDLKEHIWNLKNT